MEHKRIPIPSDTRTVYKKTRNKCDNAYLLLNRFLEGEDKGVNKPFDTKETKEELYKRIQNISFDIEPHKERLQQSISRLELSGYTAELFSLKTESRLAVGLGDANALEVGLSLHPLYGFPYIPGSSLKGLCRAWLEVAEDTFDGKELSEPDLTNKIQEEAKTVFGSRSKHEDETQLGGVLFFDAIPTKLPKLEKDIMTPHYGPYYSDPKNNPPGDWYSPTPITFLTIAPDTEFYLGLASRDDSSLQKAKEWLTSGLTELGIGAKTSSGYGYFVNPEVRAKREQKKQEKQEALRPEWAVEEEKAKANRTEKEVMINLIQQATKQTLKETVYSEWRELEDEKLKKEIAEEIVAAFKKFIKKKRKKYGLPGYLEEILEYVD